MKSPINKKRYERKFIIKNKNCLEILNLLYKSNFFFKSHFPNRNVNSIYFDTKYLKCIKENLDGISNRKKFRIRWYGDYNNIINPNFEIKIKSNFETTKKTFEMKKFEKTKLNSDENLKNLSNYINKRFFFNNYLNPTTLISYERIYLISADNLIRATIDFNIKSMKLLNSREDFFREYEDIVLEIK